MRTPWGEKFYKLLVGVEDFSESAEVFRVIHFDHGEDNNLGTVV